MPSKLKAPEAPCVYPLHQWRRSALPHQYPDSVMEYRCRRCNAFRRFVQSPRRRYRYLILYWMPGGTPDQKLKRVPVCDPHGLIRKPGDADYPTLPGVLP